MPEMMPEIVLNTALTVPTAEVTAGAIALNAGSSSELMAHATRFATLLHDGAELLDDGHHRTGDLGDDLPDRCDDFGQGGHDPHDASVSAPVSPRSVAEAGW